MTIRVDVLQHHIDAVSEKPPNPGSDEAVARGCLCPVLDNARGRGAWGTREPGALFWKRLDCPLHGEPVKPHGQGEQGSR